MWYSSRDRSSRPGDKEIVAGQLDRVVSDPRSLRAAVAEMSGNVTGPSTAQTVMVSTHGREQAVAAPRDGRVTPADSPAGSRARHVFVGRAVSSRLLVCSGVLLLCLILAGPALASGWSVQPAALALYPSQLTGVSCTSASACTAVGNSADDSIKSEAVALVERWNGRSWSLQRVPEAQRITFGGVSCTSAKVCIALGTSSDLEGSLVVGRSRGSRWSTKAVSPNDLELDSSDLSSLSCGSTHSCVAVSAYGDCGDSGCRTTANMVQLKSGRWSEREVRGRRGWWDTSLRRVSCTSGAMCVAVGYYDFGPGCIYESSRCKVRPFVDRWNGHRWSIQRAPAPDGGKRPELRFVTCFSDDACRAFGSTSEGTFEDLWNGRRWSMRRLPSEVRGMAVNNVSCASPTACSLLGTVGNGARSRQLGIANFNAGSWTIRPMLAPVDGRQPGIGGLSCPSRGVCVAVGGVEATAGQSITVAERWRRSRWSVQPTPNAATAYRLQRLTGVSCSSANACTALEFYSTANQLAYATGNAVQAWNGQAWSVAALPTDVNDISCVSATACTLVGSSAELWDGHSVVIEPTPSPAGATTSVLSSVACRASGSCTAVGQAQGSASNSQIGLAEHWSGTRWTLETVPSPTGAMNPALGSVSCGSETACMAIGSYVVGANCATGGACSSLPLAEQWNGSSWTIRDVVIPEGAVTTTLRAVSCASQSSCVAVGSYTVGAQCTSEGGSCISLPVAETWNGTNWTVQKTPNPPQSETTNLNGISCTSATACIAVGSDTLDGQTTALVEIWNGTSWAIQTPPTPPGTKQSELEGISCTSASTCTAVGDFGTSSNSANGITQPLVERLS